MSTVTKEDVFSAFATKECYDDLNCSFDGRALLVWRMYEYVPVNFETLQNVAKLFGTQKISTPEYESYRGCQTCDYGSRYTVELIITETEVTSLAEPES